MPKVVDPSVLIRQFGGSKVWEYNARQKTLFCKLCSYHFDYKKKSLLSRHVDTEKHKRHLALLDQGHSIQQQLVTTVVQRPPFVTDLAKMMVACNIPLYKTEQQEFIQFVEKYCSKTMPSRSLLTKCMEEQSKDQLKTIKAKLMGKNIFLQADETTDLQGRSMTAILVGPLDGESFDRPFLIHILDVVHNNNVTLQQAVVKALHGLFGNELFRHSLQGFFYNQNKRTIFDVLMHSLLVTFEQALDLDCHDVESFRAEMYPLNFWEPLFYRTKIYPKLYLEILFCFKMIYCCYGEDLAQCWAEVENMLTRRDETWNIKRKCKHVNLGKSYPCETFS
jgi:uncharacterized protein YhbP (UPF0306 family)